MSVAVHLCDVFSDGPLSGNSLTVVEHDVPLEPELMQALTHELRQFETIFLRATAEADRFDVRVFDQTRELDFAGHPLLGAAAVLHARHAPGVALRTWRLSIHGRSVTIVTERASRVRYLARMDQGVPRFGAVADEEQTRRVLAALSLSDDDLAPDARPSVVSTGLRYLVVPVRSGLADVRPVVPQLEQVLAELDAEFSYVIDVGSREGRHWENDGSVEDIATGSAAGPVGAFLVRHGLADAGEPIVLRQGRHVGRPSELHVLVDGNAAEPGPVWVTGPVTMMAHGVFEPEAIR